MRTKTPGDVGYATEHWTTGVLGDWIAHTDKARYKSKTPLDLVCKQAQLTCHKPGRIYHEHGEKEIGQWSDETKPRLSAPGKQRDTVILAADEMILTTQTTVQKGWLPQGSYHRIECATSGRKRRSVYGFLNRKTGREHAFKTERRNMGVTADIVKQIRSRTRRGDAQYIGDIDRAADALVAYFNTTTFNHALLGCSPIS